MTDAEKIALCRDLINDVNVTDSQISVYLGVASSRILQRLYPFGWNENTILPIKYEMIQCELAVRMIARRGGEGEIGHNESGVNRSYASVDDADIMNRIVPYVKVI